MAEIRTKDDDDDGLSAAIDNFLDGDDEWTRVDESKDWREDGPFDISEVDLDADEIQRLDFGALVVTPFVGMNLQLQVSNRDQSIQTLLVSYKGSALQVSLLAAPGNTNYVAETREAILANSASNNAKVEVVTGPLGVEIRQQVPLTPPDGRTITQSARTWLVQGPRWMLRGVLIGAAGKDDGLGEPTEMLYEFFCNLVVNRPGTPLAPGSIVPLTPPDGILDQVKPEDK
ncbi:MAG: DUF3710 domain-containing protein [Propionibacteriaceae bacterium]|jgi:hypothetical protein|nr:DUF3710 domain-containing protein [Propionibacteriaceae bacterium]